MNANPFDVIAESERHSIWERLVWADSEAFIAGDWSLIEDDFDAGAFEGIRCDHSADPARWHVAFPDLASYRASWLRAADEFRAKRFAPGISPRDALFSRTHLTNIEITGARALCHKQFHGDLPLADGTALSGERQTLFRLHRRADSLWGWRIVGFLGQLPLEIGRA